MKTILLILSICLAYTVCAQQSTKGSLKGQVFDENGDEFPFVNIKATQNGVFVAGVASDINGKYQIQNLNPGIYDIETSFIGYESVKTTGVIINSGKITFVNINLNNSSQKLQAVEIISPKKIRKVPSVGAAYDISYSISKTPGVRSSYSKKVKKQKVVFGGGNGSKTKTNRNKYSEFTENEFINVSLEALSTFSIDVDNASYSIMRSHINSGTRPPSESVRLEEMINYFKYKYDAPKDDKPFAVNYEISDSPWSENKIVKIGLKGKVFEHKKAPKNNLVFLLDVSGSMNSESKLGYVKKSMKMLVNSLGENDKIAIVTYAGYSVTVLEPTPCNRTDKIFEAIDLLQSAGSTNGSGGINRAYDLAEKHFMKNGNNRIILCTDGDFNVGVTSNGGLEKLIEDKRKTGVFLTVCGFGMGNLNDQYMETIADKGNGNYYYIDNLLEAKKVFQEDFTSTIHTIAKDVKIQIEFNPKHVKSYRLIGYDNRMLKKEDFLDDTKDAGELGAGHTVTAIYEVELQDGKEEFNNELKYQDATLNKEFGEELLTVKLRYKKPDENVSSGFEVPVVNNQKEISTDFQFILAVAEFGMILRKSKFKSNANIDHAIEFAKKGKGQDDKGYRAEFIRLMEMYQMNLASK